ncbi:hypothetical protein KFK09_019194 [Dendrobium nobile]|uniref:Uncharacterized protein n=1 Tax=Dendrobium nobile TaxID=94219 RepID=A0A8T3AWM5_DENNO|nr:hypothetical protein KFK09_019194 [Dendrobium nobile]
MPMERSMFLRILEMKADSGNLNFGNEGWRWEPIFLIILAMKAAGGNSENQQVGVQKWVAGRIQVEPDSDRFLFDMTLTRPVFANGLDFTTLIRPDKKSSKPNPIRMTRGPTKIIGKHEKMRVGAVGVIGLAPHEQRRVV